VNRGEHDVPSSISSPIFLEKSGAIDWSSKFSTDPSKCHREIKVVDVHPTDISAVHILIQNIDAIQLFVWLLNLKYKIWI